MRWNETTKFYISIWLAVATVMGVLLGAGDHRHNPLNDPDPARQRTGVLLPPRLYPSPRIGEVPRSGRQAIILFARSLSNRYLFRDLADQTDLAKGADLIVATPDGSRPVITVGIRRFARDADASLAKAFGLHRPVDGGFPVGYVLVDSRGFIRFRTLDPEFGKRAWEIKLLLGALP